MKEQAENGCVPVEGSETTRVLGSGCHWRVHLQQQRQPRSALATGAGRGGGGDRNRQRSALCAARLRHRSGQRSSSLHPRESGAGNTHRHRNVGSARGRGQGALGGECALLRRGLRGLAQASELRHSLLCLERGACAKAAEDREKSRQEPAQVELTGPHDDRQQRLRRVVDVCCVVEAAVVGSGRELAALRAPVVRLHLIDEVILGARRTPSHSLRPARHSPSTELLCPSATVVGGWLTAGA